MNDRDFLIDDHIICLIKKELVDIKFLCELNKVGFDPSPFCLDLSQVILSVVGFRHQTEELMEWYHTSRDTYSNLIDLFDHESIEQATMSFYRVLKTRLHQPE